jgi:hypothetical protein
MTLRILRVLGATGAAVAVMFAIAAFYIKAQEPKNVSMVQLIADPSKFDGDEIRVIGYLRLDFEGEVLYLHKEDYEQSIVGNGIWIDITPSQLQNWSKRGGGYAIAEGRFSASNKGHMGMWSGALKNVTRLDPWHLEVTDQQRLNSTTQPAELRH